MERRDGSSTPVGRPRLSILIPSYNGWRFLERCLSTVRMHAPADAEIVVVDDGSTDGTSDLLARHWPEVRVVRLARNSGFCQAVNQGLSQCRGEIVELLNNDTEVSAGWAEAALSAFDDPTVGAVAPLVCRLPFRGRIDSAGDEYLWIGIARKRGEGRTPAAPYDQPGEVFGASAAAAFYRRHAVMQVGGFPEHFGAYLDDVDLGFRLRLAGYHCRFEPRSRVYHWVSRSHPLRTRRMQHQVARNSEWVFWTNLSAAQLALLVLPHFAYLIVQLAYKSFRGDFGPWYAGKCSVLAQAPLVMRRRREARRLTSLPPCAL